MKNKLNTFQNVRELPPWKALAFGCALVERMLPNYQLFCDTTEFAKSDNMSNLLSILWTSVIDPKTKVNIPVQLENLNEITPDPQQFDTYGVYPALDCAMAITALFNLLSKEDEQGAVVVSKLSQGTVEAFIDMTNEQELQSEAIKAHPLMAWEVATQQEILTYLRTAKRSKDTVKTLQAMVKEEGISNIGIEI